MVLSMNTIPDIFERDIGEGEVEALVGNRIITRSLKSSTRWESLAEATKNSTTGFETIKSITFKPKSSKNIFIGLALEFEGKAVNDTGTWSGIIKITGDNTGNSSTYKKNFGSTGFEIEETGSFIKYNHYMMTPNQDESGNTDSINLAMNDTSYTIAFQVGSNGSVNTLTIKNVILNIYYIDFEDVADEVITN